jgi:hypothetical protein
MGRLWLGRGKARLQQLDRGASRGLRALGGCARLGAAERRLAHGLELCRARVTAAEEAGKEAAPGFGGVRF